MSEENKPIVRIFEELTPQQIAELFVLRPDLTKKGLEDLLGKEPEKFKEIVPSAFDQQTGLYSKIYFEKVLLQKAISEANEKKTPLSYLLLDLDKFHDFNAKYGYSKGDEAIKEFSELLKHDFRTINRRGNNNDNTNVDLRVNDRRSKKEHIDYISRIPNEAHTHQARVGGGEEFAVILYGCNENIALNIAYRFLEEVKKIKLLYLDKTIGITASGGIAEYKEGMASEQLKLNAEKALKYSKNNGRNCVAPYSMLSKS